ncbi:MAG: hypothetical protein WC506_03395 [Candidatus Micrarchaeia archaeon]
MRLKGFVFTLDATLGVFLMVLALLAITLISSQAESDPYASINALRQSHDMLAVLDAQGYLSQSNCTAIGGYLNQTLPKGMGGAVQIDTYYKDIGGFAFLSSVACGAAVPQNKSVYSVEYGLANMKNGRASNYSIARMQSWQE